MKNKLFLVICLFPLGIWAQSTIDSVLISVSKNNKSLYSANKYQESQRLLFQTGITPVDPILSFDYMKGTPLDAGNQIDFTVTQAFDFPSVYSNKKELSKLQMNQTEFAINALKQNILLEAKLICLELIYYNKRNTTLKKRKEHAEKIYNDYSLKLLVSDANILEVNKAKINFINLQNEYRMNEGEINSVLQKLTELNGGIAIDFNDTLYPEVNALPTFEEIEKMNESIDPILKDLKQQNMISKQELDLSKSMKLPKFETGYHYQAILGQQFNGIHLGMSIPLWQNKNTVQQKEAQMIYSESLLEEHKTDHYYEIKKWYEKYLYLQQSYSDYRELIDGLTSVSLLEKALQSGEISNIEFFMELSSYYETYDNLLKIEKEYFTIVAQLNKYLL